MYQLKRIICIDSYAQGLEIDVPLDQHANFNGDNGRFSLYVLANTFIPPNNHDFASLRRCSFTRNHAK